MRLAPAWWRLRIMRCFIACELTQAAVEEATRLQDATRAVLNLEDWRWVAPEDFHITILFLGAVKTHQIAAMLIDMRQRLESAQSFPYRLVGPGGFEGRIPGRVLTLMASPYEAFGKLRLAAEEAARLSNVGADLQGLRPHVTLARRRGSGRLEHVGRQRIAAIQSASVEFPIESVGLFESLPPPARPKYRCIERWPLRG